MSQHSKIVAHLDVTDNPRPSPASLDIGEAVARWRARDAAPTQTIAAMPDRVPPKHHRIELAAAILTFVLIGARCWGAI